MTCGLWGLEISGNFLFDPASAEDFRHGLLGAGAAEAEIGDLWLRGDRGAQAIVSADLAARLNGATGRVRSVEVLLEARPIQRLHLPAERVPRRFVTVEASLRLDAVASAGFGLSRQKMADRIREGAVRINWQPAASPSRELAAGDRVRLEGKGELRVEAISATKRGRYRVELQRS
jgi:photosystem II S4 domain protein